MLTRFVLVALIAATLLAYAPVRRAGFVYEDGVYLTFAQRELTAADMLTARGLTALTFRWNGLAGGLAPLGYHSVNLGLHLLVGLAMYGLARTMLPAPYALVAAGVTLLHPIQAESVAYVAGRAELLAALGALLAVWAMAGVATWTKVGVSFMAIVLSLGGKELGIMALPLVGLHAVVIRGWRFSWRSVRYAAIGLMAMAVLAWPVLQTRVLGNEYLSMSERGGLGYFAMQAWALSVLLGNAMWPAGLTIDHDYELVSKTVALSAAAALLLVTMGVWWLRKAAPVVAFGLCWMVVAVAPRFFVRQPEYLTEHHVYLPFLGLWLAMSAGLMHLDAWRTMRATSQEPVCVDESV